MAYGKRRKMTRRKSRRNYRNGSRVNRKNTQKGRPMRGGWRF